MSVENTNSKNKIDWAFYAAFVVATVSITKFFTSHRYFTQGNDLMGYVVIFVSLSLFFLSSIYLAYDTYAKEKDKNNLRVSFAPFEAIYKKMRLKAN